MKYISYREKIYGRINPKPYSGKFTYKNIDYYCGCFKTEREAMVSVDKKRISLGLEPLYLKPVSA